MTAVANALGAARTAAINLFSRPYQAAKSSLTSLAQTVIGNPVQFSLAQCRKVMLFDIGFVLTLKSINAISRSTIGKMPFNPDALLTLGQAKRATQLAELRERLKHQPGTLAFGAAVRNYLFDLIPSVVATKLYPAPLSVENWAHFKVRTVPQAYVGSFPLLGSIPFIRSIPLFPGYIVDYALDQIDRRTDFRKKILESTTGQEWTRWFKGTCTTTSHLLLSPGVLDKFVNLEQILLNILNKGHQPQNPKKTACMQQAILTSLAASFSRQADVDIYLVEKLCKPKHRNKRAYSKAEIKALLDQEGLKKLLDKAEITPAQALIARLDYHSETETLPKGLPDPKCVSLTSENLTQELDAALNNYISELIQKILDFETPKNLTEGMVGAAYYLEGKKLLNEILTFVVVEFGINMLVNPYMLAVAILTALGHETMELEIDGFGYDSHLKIFKTGKAIIAESFRQRLSRKDPPVTSGSMLKIFEQSHLRHAEGNSSAVRQKIDIKDRLKQVIHDAIYSLKDEQLRKPDSWLKTAREWLSRLPIVGPATLTVYGVSEIGTSLWSWVRRDKESAEISLGEWLGQNLMGHEISEFLADRIINLIYHPSWRITVMDLIGTIVEQIKTPDAKLRPDGGKAKEAFKKVTTFILQEVLVGTRLSGTAKLFKGDISEWITYLSGDALYTKFTSLLEPQAGKPSPVETVLTALTPTLKELTLYKRLTDIFREKGLHFKDDGKFWEMFIRECLNSKVGADLEAKRKAKFEENKKRFEQEQAVQEQARKSPLPRYPSPRKEAPKSDPQVKPLKDRIPPPPTQQEITEERTRYIDELLKMNSVRLRETFMSVTEFIPNEEEWIKIALTSDAPTTASASK